MNRLIDHPVRTIDEHATIEHRQKYPYAVQAQYMKLDDALSISNEPVVFDEDKHLEKPFESPCTGTLPTFNFPHLLT